MLALGRIVLVLSSLMLVACGDDADQDEPPTATVCELRDDPPTDDVLVSGTGTNLFKVNHGFVLSDSGCSIFVTAPRKEVTEVNDGDRIEVRGFVDALDSLDAERLEFALSRRPPAGRDLDADVPGDVPTSEGDPFFDGFTVIGQAN